MKSKKFNQVQLLTRQFLTSEENDAFDFQSRCVCALFARAARERGAELPDAWGLAGEFVAASAEAARVVPGDGDVARVVQTADVTGVMALPDSERKRAFLHLVLRTVDAFFEGATPQAFLDAASDVRAADFVNAWTWQPGTRRSPDRRWRTVVTVLHDLREYQVRLEVLDERALPAYEQVLARGDRPDETIIDGHLGELAWDEPCRLVLRPRLPDSAPVVVDLPPSFGEARAFSPPARP